LHLSEYCKFPVIGGCDIEFQGFVTAANNLFIREYRANRYANTFDPPRQVAQKNYTCSEDVTVQYVYYEVSEGNACQIEYDDFIATNAGQPLPQIFFATEQAAQLVYPGVPTRTFGDRPYMRSFYRPCLADGFATGQDYWVVLLPL
jgi:hypothetical protein